jgi:hypothetical protein
MVVPRRNKEMDMTAYKMQTLEAQLGLCPITMHECEPSDGDILYLNGIDYFVSNVGLKLLRERFGNEFIDSRVVTNYFNDDTQYDIYPEG